MPRRRVRQWMSSPGGVRGAAEAVTELRTIQETLSPPKPEPRPGLQLATCYLPAQDGVAGDFYLVTKGTERLDCDRDRRRRRARARGGQAGVVRSHGARQLGRLHRGPGEMLDLANYSLIEESGASSLFVTAACIALRPDDGSIRWSVAGHESPILLDEAKPLPDRWPTECRSASRTASAGETVTSALAFGSGLLLFTDGLTEARSGRTAAARQRACSASAGSPSSCRDAGHRAGRGHRADARRGPEHSGGELEDDVCLVALRVSPDRTRRRSPSRPRSSSARRPVPRSSPRARRGGCRPCA